MSSTARIGILYSAPLVWSDGVNVGPIDVLDHDRECDQLIARLGEANRAIEVRVESATSNNLRSLLTLGYNVLHFTGHGSPDQLVFEDGRGAAHFLDAQQFNALCGAGGANNIDLAFVSACHSCKAGEALVAAGIPHVVAVQLSETIRDDAATQFAVQFYLALVRGKSVQEAFHIGQASVYGMPNVQISESAKFVLLPEDADHSQVIFPNIAAGGVTNTTPPPPANNLPAVTEHFIGRAIDVHSLICDVLDNRLVTLRGAPGIGKTETAKAAASYLLERRVFQDGVYFLKLRGAISTEAVRSQMSSLFSLEDTSENELLTKIRGLRCLLVLDNSEDILHADGKAVRQLLSSICQQASHFHMLATSRQTIGSLSGVNETIVVLPNLDDSDARTLLKILGRKANLHFDVSDNPDDVTGILKVLQGHPQAIGLAASQLDTKSVARLRADLAHAAAIKALADQSIPEDERDSSSSLEISLGVSVDYVRQRDPDAIRLFSLFGMLPAGALEVDLTALWGVLLNYSHVSATGNVKEAASNALQNSDMWRPLADRLVRASLIDRREISGNVHYSTFPFFTTYAATLVAEKDWPVFADITTGYFSSMGSRTYREISTAISAGMQVLFGLEEENMLACIDENRLRFALTDSLVLFDSFCGALPRILTVIGRFTDAVNIGEKMVTICKAINRPKGATHARAAVGEATMRLGNFEDARLCFEEALHQYRQADSRLGEANMLRALGQVERQLRNTVLARQFLEASLQIAIEIKDHIGEANTHHILGDVFLAEGDAYAAYNEYSKTLTMSHETGNLHGIRASLGDMARAVQAMGRLIEAVLLCEQAIDISYRLNDVPGLAGSLERQGTVFLDMGMVDAAAGALYPAYQFAVASASVQRRRLEGLFDEVRRRVGTDIWTRAWSEAPVNGETHRLTGVEYAKREVTIQNSEE